MPSGSARSGDPSAAEVRAALERIVASPTFRASTQLAAFLRFVVEAALAGQSDRIKGYTIAVEALGRSPDFDPQTDPIVRVEAGRLRRALERYYANGGADDPIAIELPRGGYAPAFHYRAIAKPTPPENPLRKLALTIPPSARRYAAALGLVLAGAAMFGAIEAVMHDEPAAPRPAHRSAGAPPPRTSSYVGPIVYVEPITTVGAPTASTVTTESLRDRLRDAFARFDEVTIVTEKAAKEQPAAASASERHIPPADYSFASTAEHHADGTVSLTFRLLDAGDSTIVWSKTYERVQLADDAAKSKYPFIGQVATMLLQPFGVVHARERAKQVVGSQADARYRCLLESHEYLRSFRPALHAGVRNCLEKSIGHDPIFVNGHVALARVYLREHEFGTDVRPGDTPALERALRAAEHALELKPNSARANFALMEISITRGDLTAAKAAGERAISLNPYDLRMMFAYSAQLIVIGQIDRGLEIVRQIAADAPVPPVQIESVLFLAAYLKGDMTAASYHAHQITDVSFAPGYVARALAAAKTGDAAGARREYDQLVAVQPGWRDNPIGELKKYVRMPALRDRLARDLAEAGLIGESAQPAPVASLKARSGLPTVLIEPFETVGTPGPGMNAEILRGRLRDALGRVDELRVIAPPPAASEAEPPATGSVAAGQRPEPADYRIGASVEFRPDGSYSGVRFRLFDVPTEALVWGMWYDGPSAGTDPRPSKIAAVRDFVITLAQPNGVIQTLQRRNRQAGTMIDPRYACLLDNNEFRRGYDPKEFPRVKDCLTKATESDPAFALGFAALSRLHVSGYDAGFVESRAVLDDALRLAQRAIDLAPESARAQAAMMSVQFARRDFTAALEAGKKAVALNPYDMIILADYAYRLVRMGEIERGAALLQEAAAYETVRTPRVNFYLFLCAYLRGDIADATRHADAIPSAGFHRVYLARALLAAKSGDMASARESMERLARVQPGWRNDPRAELDKIFPVGATAGHLADDLTAITRSASK